MATLGSVPEHNKRFVPCTTDRKFEMFCAVGNVVNQTSNRIIKLHPLSSSVANNNNFTGLAREQIICLLCTGKTAL